MFVGLSLGLFLSDSPISFILYGLLGLAGGWFPDLDLHHRHRKLLHNVFALSGLTLIVYGILLYFTAYGVLEGKLAMRGSLSFAGGYLLHLLFDSLTKRGIFIFYPLSENFKIRIPLFTSRSIWGNGLAIGFGLLLIYVWADRNGYLPVLLEKLTSSLYPLFS